MIDDTTKLPQAKFHVDVTADEEGFVAEIDAESIGTAAMYLGAGRATKEDEINHAVGITLKKKIGDTVQKGDVLVTLHADSESAENSMKKVKQAYRFSPKKVDRPTLIHKVIRD